MTWCPAEKEKIATEKEKEMASWGGVTLCGDNTSVAPLTRGNWTSHEKFIRTKQPQTLLAAPQNYEQYTGIFENGAFPWTGVHCCFCVRAVATSPWTCRNVP